MNFRDLMIGDEFQLDPKTSICYRKTKIVESQYGKYNAYSNGGYFVWVDDDEMTYPINSE
jgi:hypothetical protein